MSVSVELAELRERVAEYGDVALVVTVGEDARPHVVSARTAVDGDAVVAQVGKTTSGNVGRAAAVTLVWPARDGGDYCLIVDGTGAAGDGEISVSPTRAVLHRVANATDAGPSCVTVLDRRG